MGSTGSGSFSDYPGSKPGQNDTGSGAGGASGEDRCNRALACILEEVEYCEYFATNGDTPPIGTSLKLELRDRLMAVDHNGLSVGALPTRFNFLADCMSAGFTYEGRIVATSSGAVATVSVDFAPRKP